MAKRTCFESPGEFDIKLEQRGKNNFTVTYGQEVQSGLTYSKAAFQLGAALMHRAACESKLDNS